MEPGTGKTKSYVSYFASPSQYQTRTQYVGVLWDRLPGRGFVLAKGGA